MAEREAQRTKEAEAKQVSFYEWAYSHMREQRERALKGQMVVRGKEVPWEQGRQGLLKWYVHPLREELAAGGWYFFLHDIRTHSGRHQHQGGLAIFVVEGKGWTTVDGVCHDWEEGDLILLPIKPEGVVHQHFNAEPGKSCKWLAMIYIPHEDALGNVIEQKEVSPDWVHA